MYENQTYNPYRNNIAIVKEYFKSPAVLALAIAHIVSIVISVVYSVLSAQITKDVMLQIADYLDSNPVLQNADGNTGNSIVEAIRDGLSSSSNTTIAFSIPILTILTVIGLMLLYFGSRKDDPDSAPNAGVTILNIVAILSLIGCIIAVVGMLIIVVALFFLYATFQAQPSHAFRLTLGGQRIEIDATLILILAIVFTVIAVICSFFILFYAINRKRYIGSIKKSLTTVELSRNGAKPFGVFCVILAVFTAFGLISSVMNLFLPGTANEALKEIGLNITVKNTAATILSVVSQAVSLVIMILQAKIALGYAKHIDYKRGGYDLPNDSGAGFAPVNAGVGTHTQNNPYSYLAQPKTEEPVKDDSFVNPYLDKKDVAKTTCPSCGAPTDANAPFCGNCGAKL